MPLDRQVEFRTDFFLPIVDEERETNPGVYGKALATWVKAKLEERGLQAEDIIPEDFGWVVPVSRKPFRLWLGCANLEESTSQWSIFPVAELSLLQRIYRRPETEPALQLLWGHVRELVHSIPGVSNVHWVEPARMAQKGDVE